MTVVGYVPGVFDMFHVGHLRILERARERCDLLIAGVVIDSVATEVKGRPPVVPLDERLAIVRAIRHVDRVVEDMSSDKSDVWASLHFDVIFKGDDWRGTAKGDALEAAMQLVGAKVVYLPYTSGTSSTMLRDYLDAATPAADPRRTN